MSHFKKDTREETWNCVCGYSAPSQKWILLLFDETKVLCPKCKTRYPLTGPMWDSVDN